MKAKIKKLTKDGVVRLEASGEIKEIWVNEDFLKPTDESISLGFRGKDSSGIIELSIKEFEALYKDLKKRKKIIKDIKIIK